jgi:hypothetical protein
MSKLFKTKISISFTILFHVTLHSNNNLFSLSASIFKGHKHPLPLTKMKPNKKILNVYTSHGSEYDSTCTLM